MADRAQIEKETEYVQDLPGFKRTDPHYFSDPMIDRLFDIILMMGGQMWTMRHRQAITEHLLAKNHAVTPDVIETFEPDDDFKEQLERERQDFIRSIYSGLYGTEFPDPQKPGFKWLTDPAGKEKKV